MVEMKTRRHDRLVALAVAALLAMSFQLYSFPADAQLFQKLIPDKFLPTKMKILRPDITRVELLTILAELDVGDRDALAGFVDRNSGMLGRWGPNTTVGDAIADQWQYESQMAAEKKRADAANRELQRLYDQTLTRLEQQYPQLNDKSPYFDSRLTDEAARRLNYYISRGMPKNTALETAIGEMARAGYFAPPKPKSK